MLKQVVHIVLIQRRQISTFFPVTKMNTVIQLNSVKFNVVSWIKYFQLSIFGTFWSFVAGEWRDHQTVCWPQSATVVCKPLHYGLCWENFVEIFRVFISVTFSKLKYIKHKTTLTLMCLRIFLVCHFKTVFWKHQTSCDVYVPQTSLASLYNKHCINADSPLRYEHFFFPLLHSSEKSTVTRHGLIYITDAHRICSEQTCQWRSTTVLRRVNSEAFKAKNGFDDWQVACFRITWAVGAFVQIYLEEQVFVLIFLCSFVKVEVMRWFLLLLSSFGGPTQLKRWMLLK